MNETDVYKVLQTISDAIQDHDFIWRLDGSSNLLLQGVAVSVRDLDIATTKQGHDIFSAVLQQYVLKDYFKEEIKSNCLICDIFGFEVEILSGGRSELDMFDKIDIISWRGLQVPILPLIDAKRFYEFIGRQERVALIETYLN